MRCGVFDLCEWRVKVVFCRALWQEKGIWDAAATLKVILYYSHTYEKLQCSYHS